MSSTRAELRADLRTELKKDPNAKIWTNDTLNNYLKQANLKVQKDGNFQWRENQANTTFSTVVWTQEYLLPTDLGKIQLVRYNTDVLIKTTKVWLKRTQNNFVAWIPSKYYIFWNNIGFDTIPNTTWTIDFDYVKRLTFPTDDTTTIDFNDDFDAALVKYAAFLAWSTISQMSGIAAAKIQEYQLELDTLYSTYIFDDLNDLVYWLQRRNKGFITQANVLDR